MEKAMKKAEEIASFNQGTVEALMKSSQIWTTGVQGLSKHLAATAQTQMEETMSAFKALTALRSLKDVMDMQASFARASVEKAMTETGKLTDATFKLAEETLAPLTARVTVAVETFSKAA
jgi:phasin family protein